MSDERNVWLPGEREWLRARGITEESPAVDDSLTDRVPVLPPPDMDLMDTLGTKGHPELPVSIEYGPAPDSLDAAGMSDETTRKVRMDIDLMERFATRDLDGYRLSWSWGEPDAEGFYMPTITTHSDDRLGDLDAAWAEAEAAERGRYVLTLSWVKSAREYWAEARRGVLDEHAQYGEMGPTPAEALRALAAKLREGRG